MFKLFIKICTNIPKKGKVYKIPGYPGNPQNIKIKEIGEINFNKVSKYENIIEFESDLIVSNWNEKIEKKLIQKINNIFNHYNFKIKEININIDEISYSFIYNKIKKEFVKVLDDNLFGLF